MAWTLSSPNRTAENLLPTGLLAVTIADTLR